MQRQSLIPCWLPLHLAALLLSLSHTPAATVGPDAAGYVATDATTFGFENITNTGTRVLAHADVSATNANLGFSFAFYGKAFTNVYFGHNGLISFGGTNFSYNNVNLTNSGVNPNLPTIAVLWDDWITTNATADAVYYQTLGSPGSRRFVVQWNNIYGYQDSPSGVTFEATLFEASGDILFQYLDVISEDGRNNGASATVGIRDTAGQTSGRSLQWCFNGQPRGVTNSQAIRFSAGGAPVISTQPAAASARCNTNVTLTVVAAGAAPLFYQWRFNAAPISGATTSTLTLPNVNCATSGNYSVLVSNSIGSIISSNAFVNITNAGPALLTSCPEDIVVQFFDETVPPPDPNLLSVTNLCGPVFKYWLSDSPQTNGCTITIFRLYGVSNACGIQLVCSQRIDVRVPPVVQNPVPVSQSFEADGVHVTVCANVQGTGPFDYSWSTNGFFAFDTTTPCATFVFSPIDEDTTVSVQVGNNCGGGSGGGPVTITCGVCLSRGVPNVLSSTTGSAIGPNLPNQPPNCTVGSTARWFKLIATNDSGLITISTEGSATDTVMAVYKGPLDSPASLTRVVCNDNISSSNLQSRVTFEATQGVVYWLIVDPRSASTALRLSYGFEPKIAAFSFTSNRVFQLTSTIAPAIRYRVQAATNMSSNSTNWATVLVTNLTTTYPYISFRETNAATINRRFYRLAPGY